MCARKLRLDHEKIALICIIIWLVIWLEKMDLPFFRKINSYKSPIDRLHMVGGNMKIIRNGALNKVFPFMVFNRKDISVVILCFFIPSGIHKPSKPYAASVTSIHWR